MAKAKRGGGGSITGSRVGVYLDRERGLELEDIGFRIAKLLQ